MPETAPAWGVAAKQSRLYIAAGAFLVIFLVLLFWLDQLLVASLDRITVPARFHRAIEIIGKGSVQGAVFLLWMLAGWAAKRPLWVRAGGFGLGGSIATGLIVRVFKILVGRARPGAHLGSLAFVGPSLASGYHSFPSGHAASAFFFAHYLSRWTPRLSLFWYALAGLIALTRVIDQAHFPSDILAGALIGIAVAVFALRRAAFPGPSRS